MEPGNITPEIQISVETMYLPEQSEPEQARYVFGYTISIRNKGDRAAQLLRRKWLITDANGKVQQVEGEGVIGEQPVIQPGQSHRYSSGAVLDTPVGTMEGSYGFVAEDGQHFQAPIPCFRLAVPGVLH
ncbi:MAG: Co2+/Mg2+ efflux protein ApaG [Chromatiales bacterium]|nr:Co2+/Mg2+ efflux protein ApaG [Chromatiales bacterium]